MCDPVPTDMIEMEVITSVSFDDVSAITAAKGLWLFNRNVVLSDVDCKSGRCGFFNSTAESKLELAYFSNAFDRFESFTARLFFKRSVGASGLKSLLDNSACDVPYSVLAESAPGNLNGGFGNSSGAASSFGGVVGIPIVSSLIPYSSMCNDFRNEGHSY